VLYQHKEYLFNRDWASLAFLATPIVAIILAVTGTFDNVALITVLLLFVQYVIVSISARNYALKFVTAVMCAALDQKR
jgi:hypothetical protein